MSSSQASESKTKSKKSGVGKTLKGVRQEKGLLVEEVAAELKIRESQLEAVENEEWDNLPGQVYVLGFVRSYASFLKQDADALVQQVAEVYEEKTTPRALPIAEKEEDVMPSGGLLWGLAIVLLIALGWWTYYVSLKPEVKRSEIEVSPAVETQKILPETHAQDAIEKIIEDDTQSEFEENELPQDVLQAAQEVVQQIEAKEIEKVYGPNGERVQFRALDKVWFQIRKKGTRGKVLVNKTLRKGSSYWVAYEDALADIGKPQALEIYIDGTLVGVSSLRGGIVKGLSLNPEFLANQYFGKNLHLPDPS